MFPLRRYALCVFLGATAVISLTAQDHVETGATKTAASPKNSQTSPQSEQGRRLFETHCAVCHGPHGEGGKGPTLAQPILPRASDDESLIRIISSGINNTEMPRANLQPDEIQLVAKYVRSLGALPYEPVPGDPKRGADIYAKKGGCAQCHRLHGQGGVLGPDLSDVGRRRGASYIRQTLLNPNANVPQSYSAWRADVSLPQNFLYVRAVTRDGQEISGARVNEDTFSIQIRDATGAVHSFFKSDLAELHKDVGKTPMPSFANVFTTNELDDLVAFLSSLRPK